MTSEKTTTKRKPDPIVLHVGRRIRARRRDLGMTTIDLERRLMVRRGVVKRLEEGARRISAGMLFRLGRALDVEVAYFFEGLPPVPPAPEAEALPPEHHREFKGFYEAYTRIRDPRLRRDLFDLIRAVARDPAMLKKRTSVREP